MSVKALNYWNLTLLPLFKLDGLKRRFRFIWDTVCKSRFRFEHYEINRRLFVFPYIHRLFGLVLMIVQLYAESGTVRYDCIVIIGSFIE